MSRSGKYVKFCYNLLSVWYSCVVIMIRGRHCMPPHHSMTFMIKGGYDIYIQILHDMSPFLRSHILDRIIEISVTEETRLLRTTVHSS